MPKVQDWWWRRSATLGCLEPRFVVPAGLSSSGPYPATWVHHSTDDFGACRTTRLEVKDDGRWLAPVLTPDEAAALTARAERAERERDEARHWAEDAAAAENDNAADLRAARATLEAVRAYVDQLERIGWRDLTEQSPDIAHGMNCAGAQLRIILGGSRE